MKRALIITLIAPPYRDVGADRILRFLKYLPQYDWSADVLSGESKKMARYDAPNQQKIPPDVHNYQAFILRIYRPLSALLHILPRGWYNFLAGFLMIPDAFIGGVLSLYAKGKQLLSRPNHDYNLILSSSPPHSLHLAGLLLKKKFNLPWIIDLRDPWVDNPLFQGLTIFHKKLYQYLENLVIANCDMVIANTSANAAVLRARYPAISQKIICLPNGYDPDDFEKFSCKPKQDVLRIFHGGTIHSQYDPTSFFQGLALVLETNHDLKGRIKIKLFGNQSEQKKIRQYGLADVVEEFSTVSQQEYFSHLCESDAGLLLLVPLNKKIDGAHWVPAKLYQYLGACKPVLAVAPDGEARKILENSGLGYLSYPHEPVSIKAAIIKLFNDWHNNVLPTGRTANIEIFNAKQQIRTLSVVLNKLINITHDH